MRVLGRQALEGIDDQYRHVGPIHGLDRPQRGVALRVRPARHLPGLAHAGGVDQDDVAAAPPQVRVDGIARRAGDVAHDRPVLAQKRVEQAGLSDVRPSNQGDRHLLLAVVEVRRHALGTLALDAFEHDRRGLAVAHSRQLALGHVAGPIVGNLLAALSFDLLGALRRKHPDNRVQEIGHAASVCGADRICLFPAKGVELGCLELSLLVVGLVGSHEHGRLCRPEQIGSLDVGRRHAADGIDHKDDDVRLSDRDPGLLLDLFLDRIARLDLEPPGVDRDEAPAVPLGIAVNAVAGGPGAVFHDGGAVADHAVEQSALADVRTTDHGDNR